MYKPAIGLLAVATALLAMLLVACGGEEEPTAPAAAGQPEATNTAEAMMEEATATPEALTPTTTPIPWSPLPADGKCRSGLVLKPGESCTHEYSFEIGTTISASGVSPIIEEVANEFFVDTDGKGYYGDNSYGRTSFSSRVHYGDVVTAFIAYAQSDGTFYIEEATSNDSFASPSQPDTASAPDCSAGLILSVGESCVLASGGEFLSIPMGEVALVVPFVAAAV